MNETNGTVPRAIWRAWFAAKLKKDKTVKIADPVRVADIQVIDLNTFLPETVHNAPILRDGTDEEITDYIKTVEGVLPTMFRGGFATSPRVMFDGEQKSMKTRGARSLDEVRAIFSTLPTLLLYEISPVTVFANPNWATKYLVRYAE